MFLFLQLCPKVPAGLLCAALSSCVFKKKVLKPWYPRKKIKGTEKKQLSFGSFGLSLSFSPSAAAEVQYSCVLSFLSLFLRQGRGMSWVIRYRRNKKKLSKGARGQKWGEWSFMSCTISYSCSPTDRLSPKCLVLIVCSVPGSLSGFRPAFLALHMFYPVLVFAFSRQSEFLLHLCNQRAFPTCGPEQNVSSFSCFPSLLPRGSNWSLASRDRGLRV